ncbi:hypothetical protein FOA52_008656 [Chlamydomonas sp. UWO 241]|nr:hypothetical protein FOA52_008656 [Chlamydomonas sp. UWO 241]
MQGLSALLSAASDRVPPEAHALAGCLAVTGAFVGALYVWRLPLPRSHPSTIRRRMVSVAGACAVAWLPTYAALRKGARLPDALGLTTAGLPASAALPLVLTATFFGGPLLLRLRDARPVAAARGVARAAAGWARRLARAVAAGDWLAVADVAGEPFHNATLVGWRNLVVAPLAEEFVFRGCMTPLLVLKGFSERTAVLITPLFFGVAHLHHLHDLVVHQRVPLAHAATAVGFQFAYTSVFGAYEAFLLLRTGSLAAPVLAHAFCNWMGVPDAHEMARQAGGSRAVAAALTLAGVAGAVALFRPLMAPSNFA